MKRAQTTSLACLLLAAWLTSCEKPTSDRLQGYVEGEFVYPSPPIAGKLKRLAVKRGDQVQAGDVLFEIDATQQKAACDEALQRVQQAQANLADAKKGKRPSEIQSLQAQLSQLQAATALSAKELSRQEDLRTSGAVPQESLDRARSLNEQNRFRIAQIEAEIATANLGARADLITAAEAEVTARQAALAKAKWDLEQTVQTAPVAGEIADTLYSEGEWIPAGRPVLSLLPPTAMRVRAFAPQSQIAQVHAGDEANVLIDGLAQPVVGRVSFISPQAEYTPPVIYSRENRAKLVFMFELSFDAAVAAQLHPGQPVDVQWIAQK